LMTVEEIRDNWPGNGVARPGPRTVRNDLNAGYSEGRWQRTGAGVKGDAHRYAKCDSGKPDPLRPESNRESGGERGHR